MLQPLQLFTNYTFLYTCTYVSIVMKTFILTPLAPGLCLTKRDAVCTTTTRRTTLTLKGKASAILYITAHALYVLLVYRKIDISMATLSYEIENRSKNQFEILSEGHVMSLQASSNDAMMYWLTQLQVRSREGEDLMKLWRLEVGK